MASPTNADIFVALPMLLAHWSKALLVALNKQALEVARSVQTLLKALRDAVVRGAEWVGRVLSQAIRWLWKTYHNFELHFLCTAIDLFRTIIALRVFFLLLAIAASLIIMRQWIGLAAYITFVGIAVARHFHLEEPGALEGEEHGQSRTKLAEYLRFPFRAACTLAVVFMFYWSSGNRVSAEILHAPAAVLTTQSSTEIGQNLEAARPIRFSAEPKRQEAPALLPELYDTISLKNDCPDMPIKVSVHYFDEHKGWLTRGWFEVPAGHSIDTGLHSKGKQVFFYGKSEKYIWSGEGQPGAQSFQIADGPFINKDGDVFREGQLSEAIFFPTDAGEFYGELAHEFLCR